MFEAIIKSLLGPWGQKVLAFYLEYQLVINSIVILYGIVIIVIRRRRKAAASSKQKENKNDGTYYNGEQ